MRNSKKFKLKNREGHHNKSISLLAELLVRTKDLIAEDSELVGISKALQENLLNLQQEETY